MSRIGFATLAILALGLLLGCGSANSLTGKWLVNEVPGSPPGTTGEMTYFDDDKVVLKMFLEKMGDVKINLVITIDGTYSQSGNKVTHKFSSVDIDVEGLTADQRQQFDAMMEPRKKLFLEQVNRIGATSMEWKSKDEVTLKSSKDEFKMKRA